MNPLLGAAGWGGGGFRKCSKQYCTCSPTFHYMLQYVASHCVLLHLLYLYNDMICDFILPVSLVGLIAIGSANSDWPDFVTHATYTTTKNKKKLHYENFIWEKGDLIIILWALPIKIVSGMLWEQRTTSQFMTSNMMARLSGPSSQSLSRFE